MTTDATLARFREYMVGPTRFMTLMSCFELGLIDALKDAGPLSAAELAARSGTRADAVDQLLALLVKEGFVDHEAETGQYRLGALAGVADHDLARALRYMQMIKVVALRQLYDLTESARVGRPVGLERQYGSTGTLYHAVADHEDLLQAWAPLMNSVTERVDPWFFSVVDLPRGAHVLDLAGNTGLGAVHACRAVDDESLRVTTFDLPEKEEECRRTFAAHDLADRCDFVGGDVFDGIPGSYDVVLVKHFLDMFDEADVKQILGRVREVLRPGGQVHIMVPVYPEDLHDPQNYNVDFFPAFFLGCTMGQGGPQKASVYRAWLEDSGYCVTASTLRSPSDMPPDVIPVQAVISATSTS